MASIMLILIHPDLCSSQIDTITGRLRNVLIAQAVNDREVSDLLKAAGKVGGWNDINYRDSSRTNWSPAEHPERLLRICQAYNKPGSIHFHSASLKESIRVMIHYYIEIAPVSDNWWYNAIGAPNNFGPVLVLMKTGDQYGFDQASLDSMAGKLLKYYDESAKIWPRSTTGANKIWLLKSSVYKACISNNGKVLRENFISAFEEARIMPGKAEGIKTDQSFWQHGPQLYSGGYGMAFLSDITFFGALAHGTEYAMTDPQLKVITDAVLDGFMWFVKGSAFDFGAVGRNITRLNSLSSNGLKTYLARLISMNAPRQEELTAAIRFIDGKAPFYDPGNRHFWKSDIMVQHGPGFYLSAKIPSKRTYGTERMNEENLKRKWLPWGATNIMNDGDEYRNIFPVWDWSRIPGVTSVLEDVFVPVQVFSAYIVSSCDFAGGVSNGKYGFAAYDYTWDTVSARKAYFFTPYGMYCLGAGIKAEKANPVITGINQCYSSGKVIIRDKQKGYTINDRVVTLHDPVWIHHDRVGYFFPSGGNITVKNTDQEGAWHEINLSQSDKPVKHKVFSTWITHGNHPSGGKYEYIVLPSVDLREFESRIKSNPLRMIMNTPDLQAVQDIDAGIYGIAFYVPGTVELEPGLKLTSGDPCLLLLESLKISNGFRITVSDPTTLLTGIRLKISKNLTGPGVIGNEGDATVISWILPSGDEAGKSTGYEYQIDEKIIIP
jgi:hypothetical protein